MKFLDANVILRYLTRDDPKKAEKCYELFQKVKRGEIELTTCEAVIAEVVYVLSSTTLYNLPRNEIYSLLLPIINLNGLKMAQKRLYIRALDIYASKNIDFEDALSFAHMQKHQIKEIYSYDNDFDKIEELCRLEP
ncbi:MAG: PIN domain-containing protein [Actinobacteria bacterium]|nr:PIN domain-containing protein [Actinomycetota bacterium]